MSSSRVLRACGVDRIAYNSTRRSHTFPPFIGCKSGKLPQSRVMYRQDMYHNLSRRRFAGRHEKVTKNSLYLYGVPALGVGIGFYIIGAKVLEERMMDNLPDEIPKERKEKEHEDDAEKEDEEEDDDPHIHYLRIRVIDGQILHEYDNLGGTADAYVQIGYDGKKRKTKAIKNSQTPRWNQLLRFKDAMPGKKLTIWVWDYDKLGVDDFIGRATLKPADLPADFNEVMEVTVPLQCPQKEDRGSIRVKLDFTKVNRI